MAAMASIQQPDAATVDPIPAIPVVDFSGYPSNPQVARDLAHACKTFGYCYIVNLNVPAELIDAAFGWSERLFQMNILDKMKAPHPPNHNPHRGYSKLSMEQIFTKEELTQAQQSQSKVIQTIEDYKESFDIGSENNPSQSNIWYPESVVPGFRQFMTQFYWSLHDVTRLLLVALGEGLGLEDAELGKLVESHSGNNNQLRLLHYPAISTEQLENLKVTRMSSHADWSSFTILFQDECGGLELADPHAKGKYLSAKPMANSVVLNIGDSWERLSNGLFKSANHRVRFPPSAAQAHGQTAPRYSIPYFVAPDDDALVMPFPSIVGDADPRYEPLLFKDYGEWRAKASYKSTE